MSVIDRVRSRSIVRGKVDYSRYTPEMVRWALVGWDNVVCPAGGPAEFDAENVGSLPLEVVDLFWEKLLAHISGEEEREERELKNSKPTSGD
jgi:hypothetical protein